MGNYQVFGADYVLDKVKLQNPIKIDIWETFTDDVRGKNCFLRLTADTNKPDEIFKAFKKFIESSRGDFTVFMRNGKSEPFKTATRVYLHISGSDSQSITASSQFRTVEQSVKPEDLERLITDRVNKALEDDRRERRLQQLEQDLERAKSPYNNIGEQLAAAARILIADFRNKNVQPMNGANYNPMNGTNQPTAEELQQAFQTLSNIFGAAGVVAIAKDLQANPGKVEMIKKML